MKRKSICFFLVLSLIFGLLTGCSARQTKEKDIVLTVFAMPSGYVGEQVGWFADVIYEKFHVKLNFLSSSDTNLMVMMETNTIADIIIFDDTDSFLGAADANLLYDWNEMNVYNEYGTYIKEHFGQAVDRVTSLTGRESILGIGSNVYLGEEQKIAVQYRGNIRWDLYAETGYPEIQTLEDYTDVFVAMQKAEPETSLGSKVYAMSLFPDWDSELPYFVTAIAGMYGYEQMGTGFYHAADGTWQDSMEENGIYIRVLRFLNSLYRAGLLDPDSSVQTYDKAMEKYRQGAVLFSPAEITTGSSDMYPCLPEDAAPAASYESEYGDNHIWCIGNTSVYPEICMQLLNWLYSPEGKMVSTYGPQGITWDYDSDGNPCFTEFGLACRQDSSLFMPEGFTGTFEEGFPNFFVNSVSSASINTDANGQTYEASDWYQDMDAQYQLSETENSWQQYTGCTSENEYLLSRPYTLSPDSGFAMSTMDTETYFAQVQCVSVILSGSWNSIYASSDEEFNEIVQDMIKHVNEYPYHKCIDYYEQQASERYMAEQK